MKRFHKNVLLFTCVLGIASTSWGAEQNSPTLSVEIPGLESISDRIREVSIDPITIDIRETTTGLDVEYRHYQPGQPYYGNARFDFACDEKTRAAITGFTSYPRGPKPAHGTIVVRSSALVAHELTHVVQQRKVTVRGWNPEKKEEIIGGLNSPDCRIRLTLSVTDLLVTGGTSEPAPNTPYPVRLAIGDLDRDGAQDLLFESVAGGDLVIESARHTTTPGHKYIDTLTLRGAITGKASTFFDWLRATQECGATRQACPEALRSLAVEQDGRTVKYVDGFPVRYAFPRMSVTNTTGNTMEEVSIKPIRVELK